VQNDYPEGKYINCRVLGGDKWNTGMVEVSLRESRLKGNMDDDRIPNTNETANAHTLFQLQAKDVLSVSLVWWRVASY